MVPATKAAAPDGWVTIPCETAHPTAGRTSLAPGPFLSTSSLPIEPSRAWEGGESVKKKRDLYPGSRMAFQRSI
jgi:hypothetical protein